MTSERWIRWFPVIVICVAIVLLLAFVWAFKKFPFAEEPSAWGEFGGYIGGVLSPVISLFTLVVAIRVWNLQRNELKATKNAVIKQANQQTFFSLLTQHRELVNSVRLVTDKDILPSNNITDDLEPFYEGRSAFSAVVAALKPRTGVEFSRDDITRLSKDYKFTAADQDSFQPQLLFACWYHGGKCDSAGLEDQYFPFALESSFGHVFRSTYQILKFVHDADELNGKERHDLVDHLRSQMSEDEFVLFALVSLMEIGREAKSVSIAFNFFNRRMNWLKWAKPMQESLKSKDDQEKSGGRGDRRDFSIIKNHAD